MYNAEDVFTWLDLLPNHIVEMCWGMWAERKERHIVVSKLTEGLGLIEAGIRVWGHQLNEQWAPATRKVTVRMLALLLAVKKFWRGRRVFCPATLLCLISLSHTQGFTHHHLYYWTLEMMIIWLIFSSGGSASVLKSFVCHFIFCVNCYKYEHIFFLGHYRLEPLSYFNFTFRWNQSWLYIILTYIANLRTTYNVTSGGD